MRVPFYKAESFWITIVFLVAYLVLVLTDKLAVNEELLVGALTVLLFGSTKVALKFLRKSPLTAIAGVVASTVSTDNEESNEESEEGSKGESKGESKAPLAEEDKKNDAAPVPDEH